MGATFKIERGEFREEVFWIRRSDGAFAIVDPSSLQKIFVRNADDPEEFLRQIEPVAEELRRYYETYDMMKAAKKRLSESQDRIVQLQYLLNS